jgi:hypothetical protein
MLTLLLPQVEAYYTCLSIHYLSRVEACRAYLPNPLLSRGLLYFLIIFLLLY